jgi:hypothetical protein
MDLTLILNTQHKISDEDIKFLEPFKIKNVYPNDYYNKYNIYDIHRLSLIVQNRIYDLLDKYSISGDIVEISHGIIDESVLRLKQQ